MPSDQTIIITGGRDSGYTAEYEGNKIPLTGWRLFLIRRIAAWIYKNA